MNTSAYIQDTPTPEDIQNNYHQHNGQETDNPAIHYDLHDYATMMLLQRSRHLVNDHMSQTADMGWTPRNDLKDSRHMIEAQNIQRKNKHSGCVLGKGSTPQSETRQAPWRLHGNKILHPKHMRKT